MGFFNRYPYTDFHELSLDFLLREVKSLKTSVDEISAKTAELEEIVTGHESRIDALETSNTAILGRVDALEDNVSDIGGRVGALESADIQNAIMLSDMSGVTCETDGVVIGFSKATYTNGERTTGTDNATIPEATDEYAGVMVPGDKKKLETFEVDTDGSVEFVNRVSGAAPRDAADYATKQYVDSIAISGSASTSVQDITWTSTRGTVSAGYLVNKLYSFGNVIAFNCGLSVDNITTDIENGDVIAYCDLPAGTIPPCNIYVQDATSSGVFTGIVIEVSTSGRITARNRTGSTFAVGTNTPAFGEYITWIVA